MRVTAPSSWPWIDHLVSGLHPATESPCSDSVSLRLPYSVKLATECKSLTHYTKGTPSPCGSDFLYACGFRIYFTPLPGFFSPFPHGTCSQLIRWFCNTSRFGPPVPVTAPSSWPWIDHLVSGPHPATESPYSDSISLRLPYSVKLATECKSLTHYTKGTPSPLRAPTFVSMRFQDLFHSPPGVLFAFPSRYLFTIGR